VCTQRWTRLGRLLARLTFAVLARIPLGLGSYCAVFVFSWAFAVLGLIVLAQQCRT